MSWDLVLGPASFSESTELDTSIVWNIVGQRRQDKWINTSEREANPNFVVGSSPKEHSGYNNYTSTENYHLQFVFLKQFLKSFHKCIYEVSRVVLLILLRGEFLKDVLSCPIPALYMNNY